jgi:hypothetical protein
MAAESDVGEVGNTLDVDAEEMMRTPIHGTIGGRHPAHAQSGS